MKFPYGRVVWLTGASSGIGAATAEVLCGMGYRVYGTSRSASGQTQKHPSGGFVKMLRMDVTDQSSVEQAARDIMAAEGRIDIVINNAGMGIAGAVEDTSIDEAKAQMETNVWGMLRVLRQVLPVMRARQCGIVVIVGSIAGLVPLPFQGLYSASKYALEALSGSLRQELRPFGVRVAMVEPGDCKTGFTGARQSVRDTASGVYAREYAHALGQMQKDENGGMPPVKVAGCISRVIRKRNPAWHNYCGLKYHFLMVLVKLFPAAWMETIVAAMYLPPKRNRE